MAVLFSQFAMTGLGGTGANLTRWQGEAEKYFDNIISRKGPGYLTNGQPFCFTFVATMYSLLMDDFKNKLFRWVVMV